MANFDLPMSNFLVFNVDGIASSIFQLELKIKNSSFSAMNVASIISSNNAYSVLIENSNFTHIYTDV